MWIVYYVEGKTVQFGSTRTYVGSTEVRDGETVEMAADRRVDAHKDVGNSGRGAAFLRCCGDIKLLSFSQFENRLEAHAGTHVGGNFYLYVASEIKRQLSFAR